MAVSVKAWLQFLISWPSGVATESFLVREGVLTLEPIHPGPNVASQRVCL